MRKRFKIYADQLAGKVRRPVVKLNRMLLDPVVEVKDGTSSTFNVRSNETIVVRDHQDFKEFRNLLQKEKPDAVIPIIPSKRTEKELHESLTLCLKFVSKHPDLNDVENVTSFVTSEKHTFLNHHIVLAPPVNYVTTVNHVYDSMKHFERQLTEIIKCYREVERRTQNLLLSEFSNTSSLLESIKSLAGVELELGSEKFMRKLLLKLTEAQTKSFDKRRRFGVIFKMIFSVFRFYALYVFPVFRSLLKFKSDSRVPNVLGREWDNVSEIRYHDLVCILLKFARHLAKYHATQNKIWNKLECMLTSSNPKSLFQRQHTNFKKLQKISIETMQVEDPRLVSVEYRRNGDHAEFSIQILCDIGVKTPLILRFNQIKEFHHSFSEKYVGVPKLPDSGLGTRTYLFGRKLDPEFLDKRKQKIEIYFTKLLREDRFRNSDELQRFLLQRVEKKKEEEEEEEKKDSEYKIPISSSSSSSSSSQEKEKYPAMRRPTINPNRRRPPQNQLWSIFTCGVEKGDIMFERTREEEEKEDEEEKEEHTPAQMSNMQKMVQQRKKKLERAERERMEAERLNEEKMNKKRMRQRDAALGRGRKGTSSGKGLMKRRFVGVSCSTSSTSTTTAGVRYKFAKDENKDKKKKTKNNKEEYGKRTKKKNTEQNKTTKSRTSTKTKKEKMPWERAQERAAASFTTFSSRTTSSSSSSYQKRKKEPEKTQSEKKKKKKKEEAVWIEAKSDDGEFYYYHRITRDVRWERPPDHLIYQVNEEEMKVKAQQEERLRHLEEEARKREKEEEDLVRLKSEIDHLVDNWTFGKELKHLIIDLPGILPHIESTKFPKLKRRADESQVKRAYRKVIRLVHPDKQKGRTLRERLLAQRVTSALLKASSEY